MTEIRQHHIDYVNAIAAQFAQTSLLGGRLGADELQSEGLVILWDLALSWDKRTGVPFRAYLGLNVRRRLIDYVRRVAGRHGQDRLTRTLSMVSLQALKVRRRQGEDDTVTYDVPSTDPGPEDIVVARDELSKVTDAVLACTERQRDALLWPVTDKSSRAFRAKWRIAEGTARATRSQAKNAVLRRLTSGRRA